MKCNGYNCEHKKCRDNFRKIMILRQGAFKRLWIASKKYNFHTIVGRTGLN